MEAIKTVPYAPLSQPFVERLIGTIRRECLDRMLFWTAADLEAKLLEFQRTLGSSPKSVMRDPLMNNKGLWSGSFHRLSDQGTGSKGRSPHPCQIAAT